MTAERERENGVHETVLVLRVNVVGITDNLLSWRDKLKPILVMIYPNIYHYKTLSSSCGGNQLHHPHSSLKYTVILLTMSKSASENQWLTSLCPWSITLHACSISSNFHFWHTPICHFKANISLAPNHVQLIKYNRACGHQHIITYEEHYLKKKKNYFRKIVNQYTFW